MHEPKQRTNDPKNKPYTGQKLHERMGMAKHYMSQSILCYVQIIILMPNTAATI